MAISIWKKPKILRRYVANSYVDGYQVSGGHIDKMIRIDLQTTSNAQSSESDGDDRTQMIKGFTDFKVRVADSDKDVRADRIWFQDMWFECVSSRLSENTFLKHWTSTFVKCEDQEEPPLGYEREEEKECDCFDD